MSTTIPHWLEKQYELKGGQIALEDPEGVSVTFKDLRNKSRSIASSMLNDGIRSGDHIAFLAENDVDLPAFLHAISYVGAVAVLLNTRLSPEEITFQLNDAQVSRLFAGSTLCEKAVEAAKGADRNIEIHCLESYHESFDRQDLKEVISLDDVYTMMYTSGTTGSPKAVMHTYGNHWHSAVASGLNLGIHTEDKWLLCLPMFHVGGFSILMKSVIYGMPVHLVNKFDAEVVNRQVFQSEVTHISAVSIMLQKMIDQLGSDDYPSHFRCMLLGGGPVPEQLLRQATDRNIPVYQTYGMTETSSQISTLSPRDASRKIGSAGKALTSAELKVDASGKGEVGEIMVKGPMVTGGYFNRPPLTEEYFRTGDLGYEDEEGFLYVVDRANDMIISGGENVYPAEIEKILSEMKEIAEIGVTGEEDPEWGEIPVAFVVVKEGEKLDLASLQEFCRERLAKYKVPKRLYFVREIPRNASNKILRRKLFSALQKERDEYEN
ncbi:o-succinylbenzoate--CoA ligase [Halobacillus yeomjeoni]|uniref:o-succinylbenzoate--CoA ligase n=1 Tax=Halobacillus yeomjeoni TaxID=311194 RepID=UPI001CD2DF85|nr:o-succinylbenzoate--CoA ligase [Halobacillus yeomjeoni]MCA0984477.1 o-succinylbenzoate--CoA ligase [Halobacillus yeomjeoni]